MDRAGIQRAVRNMLGDAVDSIFRDMQKEMGIEDKHLTRRDSHAIGALNHELMCQIAISLYEMQEGEGEYA